MDWYVIHTKPKQEFRAEQNLNMQGYTTLLLTVDAQKLQKCRIKIQKEPLFPRYLFIQLDQTSSNWFPIKSTRGVHKIVRFGLNTEPVKVHPQLIEALQNMQKGNNDFWNLFNPGDSVMIQEGPFQRIQATFKNLLHETSGGSRAMILLDILGKTQELNIPIHQIRKVD